MLRSLTIVALAATPAAADLESSRVRPFPSSSITLGFTGHSGKLSGLDLRGVGPFLEFALGRDRWQPFVEAGAMRVELGPDPEIAGYQLRAGLGIRWLARSFELGKVGAIDMHLEGFGGVSRSDFDGMNRLVRPDLGFGVGYLVRLFHGRAKQKGLRISARVAFAPTDRDTVAAACRGICPMAVGSSNAGFLFVMGAVF